MLALGCQVHIWYANADVHLQHHNVCAAVMAALTWLHATVSLYASLHAVDVQRHSCLSAVDTSFVPGGTHVHLHWRDGEHCLVVALIMAACLAG